MKVRLWNFSSILSVALSFLGASNCYGITLGQLSSTSGSITQGSLLFDNFDIVSPNNIVEGNALPADVSEIDVTGITSDGNHGLRFTGPFSATTTDTIRALGQYNFFYDVMSLNSNLPMSGIGQSFFVTKSGDATGEIVTRIERPSEPPSEQLIQLISGALETGFVSDSGNFRDLDGTEVMANSVSVIEFWTFQSSPFVPVASDGNIQVDYVDVVFFQQPIPIPGAVWLFGSGLLGMIVIARRKRAA